MFSNSNSKIKKRNYIIVIFIVIFIFFGIIFRFDFPSDYTSDYTSDYSSFENKIQWCTPAEEIGNLERTGVDLSTTEDKKVYEGALVEGIYYGEGLTTYMFNENKLYQVNIALFTNDDIYKDVAKSLDEKFTELYGQGNYSLADRSWYTEKTKIRILWLNHTFIIIYKDISVDF
jgi:hypothetical protein